MKLTKISFCFLVILFFSFFCFFDVYAVDTVNTKSGWVCSSDITDTQSGYLGANITDDCIVSTSLADFTMMATNIKTNYCKAFLESAKNDFTGLDFIASYTLNGTYEVLDSKGNLKTKSYVDEVYPITTDFESVFNAASDSVFTLSLQIGDLNYEFKTYTKFHYVPYEDSEGETKYILRSKLVNDGTNFKNQAKIADNTKKMLKLFRDSAFEGIVAGSIGSGFNVGVAYSEKQEPLKGLMTLVGSGYEFTDIDTVDFTFSYYYSPIFGKMFALKDPKLPKTKEEWITYANANSSFIQGGSIVLDPGFSEFISTLSDKMVNEKGEKIVDVKMDGGAKKFNVSGSENPRSVLSYNMPMAVPYLFQINNGKGKLMTDALKIVENYTYCLFNDRIYDDNNVEVAIMGSVLGSSERTNLYLYKKEISEVVDGETKKAKTGVVIIGYFDECVVDTTQDFIPNSTSNLLLTGRKIGITNAYSDALDFNNANSNLMYVTGESGGEAYSPVNVSFPIAGLDLKMYDLYDVWSGKASEIAPDLTDEVKKIMNPISSSEMLEYINTQKWHGSLPSTVKAVRFFIGFGPLTATSDTGVNGSGSTDTSTDTSTVNSLNTGEKYAFYIVRNNKYVNDPSLISWLKTDLAKSIPYVDAERLLAKITGDFREELDKLTYSDWLEMQKIKSELTYDKDMWLIRGMNIMSIVLGVFFIIFAVLFMLSYWFDVFNTLTDFSILQFVSFGNLYPTADKSTVPYLREQKGNTKFVTFKDVLILACIMIAGGILFMNVSYLIGIISSLYHYIMFVLGGVGS